MKIRHVARPAFAVVGVLGLAACGDDADKTANTTEPPVETIAPVVVTAESITTSTTASPDTEPVTSVADFNDADVSFAQGMIPHHEQAIEMADVALDPTIGAGEAVLDLATRIKGAQDPEIELMTTWLTAWGEPVQMDMSDGHDMASMEGVMSVEEMDALEAASGAAFDTMWMEMMIRHHEGAISTAEAVKAEGSNADVAALADQIITGQQAEIDEMQALLDAPSGT